MQNHDLTDSIVVIGEVFDEKIVPLSLEILGMALSLGYEIHRSVCVILSGNPVMEELETLSEYGPDQIICLEHPKLENGCVQYHLEVLCQFLSEKKPPVILTGADSFGRVLAPQLAFALNTEIVTDACGLFYDKAMSSVIIRRPAADGKRMSEYLINTLPVMVSFRPGICQKAIRHPKHQCEITRLYTNCLDTYKSRIQYKSVRKEQKDNRRIEDAQVVICGGRGMKGKEGFELLDHMAKELGGQTGCTRPCVDAGWMPVSRQIGQSGITVHPKLYIACGLSGSIQHMAGVQAETLIAVNNNPDASIFRYCDYGFVGDAANIISKLMELRSK